MAIIDVLTKLGKSANAPEKKDTIITHSKTADEPEKKDAANMLVVMAYLDRIGIAADEADALMAQKPSAEALERLLTKHQVSIPFENLGQHDHPADDADGIPHISKGAHIPTLEVHSTLKKLVFDRRGGFCWELNVGFAWLLRSLGYRVRMSNAHVITPAGPVPGHLCLLVDGLGADALLVDPGFGDSPRALVPAKFDSPATDVSYGDRYTLVRNDGTQFGQSPEQAKRFNAMLMRERKCGIASSPMVDFIGMDTPPPAAEMSPPEPVYLFNMSDDCALDCAEFVDGLAGVLAEVEQNPFSQKRMCIMMNETGYTFVGQGYVKTVAHGKEVERTTLTTEKAYREALERAAGIKL